MVVVYADAFTAHYGITQGRMARFRGLETMRDTHRCPESRAYTQSYTMSRKMNNLTRSWVMSGIQLFTCGRRKNGSVPTQVIAGPRSRSDAKTVKQADFIIAMEAFGGYSPLQ